MQEVIAGSVIIVASVIVYIALVKTVFYYRGSHDETHIVETEDGRLIALYRFIPKTKRYATPVILCHGLGANHFSWDPSRRVPSFANYLKNAGFEVWTIDLRGIGTPARLEKRKGLIKPANWTFDDYVKYDVARAISYVSEQNRGGKVNWVGHSMGGMVMYAYLQIMDSSKIISATAIASPANFKHYRWLKPIAPRLAKIVKKLTVIKWSKVALLFAPFGYFIPVSKVGTPRQAYPWFGANGVGDVSSGVLCQFLDWIANERFCSADCSYSYRDNFDKITTPFLVVEGGGDWIAPPPDVKHGIDNMSSYEKKYAYFSRKTGASYNYDHMSILLGKTALNESWREIFEWLIKHSEPTN